MHHISRSALVPYSAREMFDLVADVEAYPDFLPWCADCRVLSRDEDEVVAELHIHYSGLDKRFTTCNRMQPGKMLEMRLREGPFSHLQGFWRFQALGERGSKISLDLDFRFASRLLDMMVAPVFTRIADGLVDAFHRRAVSLYGRR